MGRRKKRNISILHDFKMLDREYTANITDSPMVEALNMLPVDERAFMILYVAVNHNKAAMAEYLHCSTKTVLGYVRMLKIKLNDNLLAVNKQREKNDEIVF